MCRCFVEELVQFRRKQDEILNAVIAAVSVDVMDLELLWVPINAVVLSIDFR